MMDSIFSQEAPEMYQRIAVILVLAALLFGLYTLYFRTKERFIMANDETPAYAGPESLNTPNLPERTVMPGGPNSPSMASVVDSPVTIPESEAMDPYAEKFQKSQFVDDNRAPERLFGPARDPVVTGIAAESGVASVVTSGQPNVYEFTPESAQNGGAFMNDTIFANDTMEPKNFAAF